MEVKLTVGGLDPLLCRETEFGGPNIMQQFRRDRLIVSVNLSKLFGLNFLDNTCFRFDPRPQSLYLHKRWEFLEYESPLLWFVC